MTAPDITARIAESRRLLEESTERDNGKPWRVDRVHDKWVELRVGYGFANRMVVDCVGEKDAALIVRMRDEYAALLDMAEAASKLKAEALSIARMQLRGLGQQGKLAYLGKAAGDVDAALAAYARAGGAQ